MTKRLGRKTSERGAKFCDKRREEFGSEVDSLEPGRLVRRGVIGLAWRKRCR
jgi:hypothetical protein